METLAKKQCSWRWRRARALLHPNRTPAKMHTADAGLPVPFGYNEHDNSRTGLGFGSFQHVIEFVQYVFGRKVLTGMPGFITRRESAREKRLLHLPALDICTECMLHEARQRFTLMQHTFRRPTQGRVDTQWRHRCSFHEKILCIAFAMHYTRPKSFTQNSASLLQNSNKAWRNHHLCCRHANASHIYTAKATPKHAK